MASGAAVYSDGGTVTLSSDNRLFQYGSRRSGWQSQIGSLYCWACTARPAEAETLAGYAAQGGTLSVNSSTLSGNIAQGGGGGAGLNGAGGAVGGSAYGGAIYISIAGFDLSGDTLSSNTAQGGNAGVGNGTSGNGLGGGIYEFNNPKLVSVLTNTTLSSNTAQGGSGQGGDEAALNGNGLGGAIYIVIGSIELDMGAVSSNVARGAEHRMTTRITTVRVRAGASGLGTEPTLS